MNKYLLALMAVYRGTWFMPEVVINFEISTTNSRAPSPVSFTSTEVHRFLFLQASMGHASLSLATPFSTTRWGEQPTLSTTFTLFLQAPQQ